MTLRLREDVLSFLSWQERQHIRPLGSGTLAEARENRSLVGSLLPRVAAARVRDEVFSAAHPALQAKVVAPSAGAVEGTAIYLHGGGWSIGRASEYLPAAAALADLSGFEIWVLDYALAPEHPFPTAADQSRVALAVLQDRRREADDHRPIVVIGDSAGATLAIDTCMHAARRDSPVNAQVLIYPVTDLTWKRSEVSAPFPGLSWRALDWFTGFYVPPHQSLSDPRISPLKSNELRLAPPTAIITAEHDILNPQIDEFARRLRSEGVPTEAHRIEGQIHTFVQLPGVLSGADEALALIAGRMRALIG